MLPKKYCMVDAKNENIRKYLMKKKLLNEISVGFSKLINELVCDYGFMYFTDLKLKHTLSRYFFNVNIIALMKC